MNTLHTLRISAAPLVLGLAMVAGSAHAQQAPSITNGNAGSALASEAPAADTIVVTGSRIANPNLKALAPITTLNATDIKASGVSSAEELINQLPQVFAGQGSTVSNGATGTATVDLRGLGATRTLVLVNGRRLMPGDPGSSASHLAGQARRCADRWRIGHLWRGCGGGRGQLCAGQGFHRLPL
jgi:iron complex outermembrane receptor protein